MFGLELTPEETTIIGTAIVFIIQVLIGGCTWLSIYIKEAENKWFNGRYV